MIAALVLDDLLIWSAQVCVLVIVGALAAPFDIHPRGRLVFWQEILAISATPARGTALDPSARLTTRTVYSFTTRTGNRSRWPFYKGQASNGSRSICWAFSSAGSALRALWLAAGFLRLRRYRRSARETDAPIHSAARRYGWFVSTAITRSRHLWLAASRRFTAGTNQPFGAGSTGSYRPA